MKKGWKIFWSIFAVILAVGIGFIVNWAIENKDTVKDWGNDIKDSFSQVEENVESENLSFDYELNI